MLKKNLKIAFRNLLKHKGYSLINIIGLAVGMACCLLILLYVQDELSYDRFYQNADQIYRVTLRARIAGNEVHVTNTAAPMATAMMAEFPEVKAATRIDKPSQRMVVRYADQQFIETKLLYADSMFFAVFQQPMLQGNPNTALSAPNTIVITDEIAQKYFGNANPIDQVITINSGGTERPFTVTGVVDKLPNQSHFHFDFLASIYTLPYAVNDRWTNNSYITYFYLQKGVRPQALEAKLPEIIRKYVEPQIQQATGQSFQEFVANGGLYEFRLQKMTDIHLHSNIGDELEANSDMAYVSIFSLIAFFILLLACINFMNLATARSANRAKEVGVRKAIGSSRSQLIWQFLGESLLLSSVAMVLAILLAQAALPFFNTLAGKQIEINYFSNAIFLPGIFAITVIVGVLAGLYPALFLASFQPVEVLKGKFKAGMKSRWFRSGLVVFQFGISIVLLIGAFVISDQMRFINSMNLGFNKEQVVVIHRANTLSSGIASFEEELRQLHQVSSTSVTRHLPGNDHDVNLYRAEGTPEKDGYLLRSMEVGFNFIETLGMEMVAGRSFSSSFGTDSSGFIINEAAVRKFGWSDAVGKTLAQPGEIEEVVRPVIGVVKDFHFESVHHTIEPAVLSIADSPHFMLVRIKKGNVNESIEAIRQAWETRLPDEPFQFTCLDDDFDQLYRAVQRTGSIVSTFTLFSVFIACLGLLGLASFAAEQRTKEIGVRKVLGAHVGNIVFLLSKEFTVLVGAAFLLAAPIAYFGMSNWLQGFAYRASMSSLSFLMAGGITLCVAWLTVGYQTIKAAFSNPIKALRYE